MSELAADPYDVRRARRAAGLLAAFNEAGVLSAADVHVAARLAALAAEPDESVALAAALAVRAPRLGHVLADLATIRDTATVDADEPVELSALPWPEPAAWTAALARSPLVAVGEEGGPEDRPLRLAGTWLYLDRYWRDERRIAADLRRLGAGAGATAGGPALAVDEDRLADGLGRLFGLDDPASRQRLAAATAVRRRLAVVAGGPGTGKTTTVARIVALLAEQSEAGGGGAPVVALAAPTGKAAARLEEAVHEEALRLDVSAGVRAHLRGLEAVTLHRLLGRRPDSRSRFRHHSGNRLPHDVVVVDETSMVPMFLMARLVEAVRPQARLVLVGDPDQLASIEAGAVLGDIVGPAAGGEEREGIVLLDRVHRFGGGIARVAESVRRGDGDAVVEALAGAPGEVEWIDVDVAGPDAEPALAAVRERAVAAARDALGAARAGNAPEAIRALGTFRLLCAHRHGPEGVDTWATRVEGWLAAEIEGFGAEGRWYLGRPLLVTANDYSLRLYNGDTGVVVAAGPGRVSAAFERRGGLLEVSPTRLAAVDTVHAMTIHKSQGSQFDTTAVLLPAPASRLLTRELLYTAVTRARERLIVAGSEATVRAAVERPVTRASGLRRRLYG